MNLSAEAKAKGLRDESVLHVINRYITLKDDDIKRNNEILKLVIQDIVDVLKNKNAFFREFYSRIEFVGSHYKGTKVGKPEEFDLNLIIRLPIDYQTIDFEYGLPGFRMLKLRQNSFLPKWEEHSKLLSKWVHNGYLNQDKFRQWAESLFADMPTQTRDGRYQLKLVKSGPAFTLNVRGPGLHPNTMSVDLVPVLEFKKILTPLQVEFGQRDESWFAVPKPFKSEEESPPPLNWRPSFYIYEKNMLRRDGKFKPTIRQMKKLRDNQNWKLIASYHIETLFMHKVIAIKNNPALQKLSGIELFIHMLERLKSACEKVEIRNFWDGNHNLIGHYNYYQLQSIVGRLRKIIGDIKADPVNMAKYLLTDLELREVQRELDDIRNGCYSGRKKQIQAVEQSEEPAQGIIWGIWNLLRNILTVMF